jgi:DNA polymerase-1
MADYSSIEVRVLAEISKDTALLSEAIYGDVHAASAADRMKMKREDFLAIYNDKLHPLQPAYKAMRGKAKAITFSVCYGSGIANLALGLKCTDEEAAQAMEAWALRYPKAFSYRQVMFEKLQRTGFIELVDGRSIFVFKEERTLPVASNYGIQGAAASVMYRAIYHTQRLLFSANVAARMGATIHDELIIRARKEDAEQTKQILQDGMELGWLDIFPGSNTENLADAGIGFSWAEKA